MRMRQGGGRWLMGAVLTLGACAHGSVKLETQAAAIAQDPRQQPTVRAKARFVEMSQQLEKLGSEDRVDPNSLRAQLQEVVALDPQNVPARFDLAALQALAGESDRARTIWQQLADEDPSFVPAVENAAAAQVRAGKLDVAIAVYQKIIAKDAKNITSRLALARLVAGRKHHQEAIDLCRAVLQRQADAIEAFRVLALSYTELGNVPMAQLIIGRAFKVAKDDVELHHLLARILLEQDDLIGGLAKLKEVVRMAPSRVSARGELAEIALSYRDFGNAAQQYEAILKERPNLIPVQVNLAVSYKGLGRYDQAEALYREVLAKEPNQVASLWNLGVLYHRHLKRYDDAVAMLQKFKAAAPSGDARGAQVDPMVAEIQKQKSDVEAQRAQAERDRKRTEGLAAACAAVVAKKPPDAAAIGNEQERVEAAWQLMVQGQQAIQAGDVPGGEASVHCAFAIVPKTPAIDKSACAPMRVMWTQILYQLGRLEEANTTIGEALGCDAENPDAQLIQQQLKELMAQQAAQATPAPEPGPEAAPAKDSKTEPSGSKKEKKR